MASQMGTYTKRRFPTYTKYATSPISKVVDPELLASATTMTATNLRNSWVENLGDGTFRMHDLPIIAQAAPILGTVVEDFNRDGFLDILALENFYGADREVIRYDAGLGLLMLGDGSGGFQTESLEKSGFLVPTDGRALGLVRTTEGYRTIAVSNNAPVRLFGPRAKFESGERIVDVTDPLVTRAVIRFADGSERIQEIHYGSGYLSQSSRMILVPRGAEEIRLFAGDDEREVVKLDE